MRIQITNFPIGIKYDDVVLEALRDLGKTFVPDENDKRRFSLPDWDEADAVALQARGIQFYKLVS